MGGIESHCEELLPRLKRAAPDLRITVLGRSRYVPKQSCHQGVEQIGLWAPRNGAAETIVHTVIAILHARLVLRVDWIHLHGIGPGLATPLARLLALPVLFTHHGEDYRRQKWGRVAKFALQFGEVLAVRCANRVIAVSPSSERRLRRRFPRIAERIVHIPNGVPPVPKTHLTGPPDVVRALAQDQYAVSVGRLVPEKGQDLLIKAYRKSGLWDQIPPVRLLIVGAADHQSEYSKQLMAEAGDGVVFAGRLSRDEVMALNRNAALFVLPSYHEGLSIAALECLRAGTPILLSDIEANRDIGLPARHYFETGSVDALAEKLRQPLNSYAVTPDFDMKRFDWDRIAEQTLEQLAAIRHRGVPLFGQPPLGEGPDNV